MSGNVLVTGASGCVGSAVVPLLRARGLHVRSGMRRPRTAHDVRFDLDDDSTLRPALKGCDAAVYLVHGLARGAGYEAWEERTARAFAQACRDEGVARVVYLGGVVPAGAVSAHLRARARTGEVLRDVLGDDVVVELRAGMIIAATSASFMLTRDLAARAPVLIRPPWLSYQQAPVALCDITAAIAAACGDVAGGIYSACGPDTYGADETLLLCAKLMGLRLRIIDVSRAPHARVARLLGYVTRADATVVHELVFGMTGDLLGTDPSIFDRMPHYTRTPLPMAMAMALRDDVRTVNSATWFVERAMQHLGRRR